MKIRKLYIDNFRIFQDFSLDFTFNGKTLNLIVISGINGTGKTTLLKDFIYHAFNAKDISKNSYIEIEYKQKEKFKTNAQSLNHDFFKNSNHNFLLSEFKNIILCEPGVSDTKTAKQAIIQFIDNLIYEKDKKSSEAYLITQEILNSIFKGFDLQIEFKGIDKTREVLFKNDLAEKIRMEELSGGEQEVIAKAFSLYLSDIKESVILIDEPESSLHPNWQNRIAQIYQNIADKNNNQVILATHSPHIVGSVRKEQVRVLAKHGNKVKAVDNFNGSYGWKVDRVLLDIFRTPGLRTPPVEEKLAGLRDMVFADKYETGEFKKFLNELERTIGYDDMDLALIRMEVAKRKSAANEKNKKKRA